MPERSPADALDRFLDALVAGDEPPVAADPELMQLARRYVALGQAPAPPGARERVHRRVAQQAGPRHNGRHASDDPSLLLFRLEPDGAPMSPADALRPLHALPASGSRHPAFPGRALPVVLLVLAVLVAMVAWVRQPGNPALVIPAAEVATPAPAPAPTPPAAGQTVLEVAFPAGALPAEAYGVTFDVRTMPPHLTSSESSKGPLLIRSILSGQIQVQSDAPLEVWKAGGTGEWQPVPAATPQELAAGDAIFLRGAGSLEWTNAAPTPAAMIAWQMTDQGGGNSEIPSGWDLVDQDAVHMGVLEHPEQPARLVLRRIDLAPGKEVGPPPGSWLSHFVSLDRNAAGETVAPMFGKLPDGAWRNAGRQELTIYQYSLDPLVPPAAPDGGGSP